MNIDTTNKKKSRRNPKTSRPLKKLLGVPPLLLSDKYSIHHHRRLFLKGLTQHHKLPPFKQDLWSGTCLHLLVLLDKITPDMYQAAITYASFGHKNLFAAPTLSQIPLDENLLTFERKKNLHQMPMFSEKAEDAEAEKIWRDLNEILIETNSKALLDYLTENESLDAAKNLLEDKTLLKKLRKGLNSLKKYLEKTSI